MSENNNNAHRVTPEQKLTKTVHQLCISYLAEGGNTAFLIGMGRQLEIFWEAPDRLNAQRQSEQMIEARSQTPKDDAQNSRQ
jgi:hypothetical protein